MKRPKNLGAKLLLVLLSLALTLVLIEVGLSRYMAARLDHRKGSGTLNDKELGWWRTPNVGSSNDYGLRASPNPDEIPPDHFVIAVQGDSQIEGYGLADEETFTYHLENCLNAANPPRPVTLLNFGMQGYDLNHYLSQAYWLTEIYEVDLTVLAINYNDYGPTLLAYTYSAYRPYWTLRDGQLEKVYPPWPFKEQIYGSTFQPRYAEYQSIIAPTQYNELVYDASHPLAWSWTYYKITEARFASRSIPQYTNQEQDRGGFYQPYDGKWLFAAPIIPPYSDHRATVSAMLAAWQALFSEAYVFYLPSYVQFDDPEFQDLRNSVSYGIELLGLEQTEDFNAAAHFVRDIVTEQGLPFHDFYDDLSQEPKPLDYYLYNDGHLNAEGIHYVALRACEQLMPYIQ